MAELQELNTIVDRLARSVVMRRLVAEEAAIQALIDDAMTSGAMRRDFDVVLVWRCAGPGFERSMQPRLA